MPEYLVVINFEDATVPANCYRAWKFTTRRNVAPYSSTPTGNGLVSSSGSAHEPSGGDTNGPDYSTDTTCVVDLDGLDPVGEYVHATICRRSKSASASGTGSGSRKPEVTPAEPCDVTSSGIFSGS